MKTVDVEQAIDNIFQSDEFQLRLSRRKDRPLKVVYKTGHIRYYARKYLASFMSDESVMSVFDCENSRYLKEVK